MHTVTGVETMKNARVSNASDTDQLLFVLLSAKALADRSKMFQRRALASRTKCRSGDSFAYRAYFTSQADEALREAWSRLRFVESQLSAEK